MNGGGMGHFGDVRFGDKSVKDMILLMGALFMYFFKKIWV